MARIKIVQYVYVDLEEWAENYGLYNRDGNPSKHQAREDVKYYFKNYIQDRINYLGLEEKKL